MRPADSDVSNVAPIKPTTTEYYGGCPRCGKTDGYVNFGRDHWFGCATHRVRWYVGSNLFSSCHEPKTQEEIANDMLVRSFAVVEPVHPDAEFYRQAGEPYASGHADSGGGDAGTPA